MGGVGDLLGEVKSGIKMPLLGWRNPLLIGPARDLGLKAPKLDSIGPIRG